LVNIHAQKNQKAYIKAVLKEDGLPDVEFYVDGETATIEAVRANSSIRESGIYINIIPQLS
jgi:uncharacterized protein (DUF1499 family)